MRNGKEFGPRMRIAHKREMVDPDGRGDTGHALAATIVAKPAKGRLLPHVAAYFLYDDPRDFTDGRERVDLGQIRFLLRGRGRMTYPDGHSEAMPEIIVAGPSTAAAQYELEGPFLCFGVVLRAMGWKAMIGRPANAVTDHMIDGRKLFCDQAPMLLKRLRGMQTLDDMISAIAPLLLMRQEEVKPVPSAHFPFLSAVREWAASGETSVAALYEAIRTCSGLGERQVQRLCLEYFGGSPAMLKRKFRATRTAMKLYQGASISDVLGPYSDQSHMINEVKHFTGYTPTALRSGDNPILAMTLDSENFHILPQVFPESVDLRRK